MNIFILDTCPIRAASYLCDKHVPKMLLGRADAFHGFARRWGESSGAISVESRAASLHTLDGSIAHKR